LSWRLFCTADRQSVRFLPPRRGRHLEIGCFTAALLFFPYLVVGQSITTSIAPALLDNMDGQTPVLQPLFAGSRFTAGGRTIDRKSFRHGSGAERILVRGPAGEVAELVYRLPPAPVIRELSLRADVVTNRAGLQLAARVVLPRSLNRTTGRPIELLVRGGKIGSGGNWEELTLENLPAQLANHARVARSHRGIALDERGAYVSQIVFLAPGGTGMTELLVDRIRVFGVVGQPSARIAAPPRISASTDPAAISNQKSARVPRIIQWQGEPFQRLKQLGFNTIAMSRLPTTEELRRVEQLGLALFCPPPAPSQLSRQGIGADLNSVLAWNLGEQLSPDDLDHVERWESLVARHDPIDVRPTVLAPQLYTLAASRIADVMLVGRAVVGSELTIRQHTAWLTQRQRLARPGTPLWTQIETQPSPSQRLQMTALSSRGADHQETTYAQLTALTSASLNIKTRGFYFLSQTSLAAQDAQARRRALALELTNLRLQLLEPWLVAGRALSGARSSQPELSALVMQAERSHLLVPIWWSLNMQSPYSPGNALERTQFPGKSRRARGPVSFIVPGVAESSEAFLLTLGGIQRLQHERVTGGVRVSLEALPFDSVLMFSDDPQAIAQVTRYVRRIAPRATKIRRELTHHRLQEKIGLLARVKTAAVRTDRAQAILAQAQRELTLCDQHFSAKHYPRAYLHASAANLAMDALENALQTELQAALSRPSPRKGAPMANGAISHVLLALPDRLQLQKSLARSPVSANLLTGGGFENLSAMLNSGWRHQQLPLEGITTSVRLSPEAPYSGSYCLELKALPMDALAPDLIVPTAPVWITTSPLPVRAGDLLEITGVARLPKPLVGSVDGLQIIDSIGGPDLALRIHEAPSWQPFRLIRAATSDSQVSVTIALSGLGKAQIDDVAVRILQRK